MKVDVSTVSVLETTPSIVMVNVPVPAPVVTVRVAAVPLLCVHVPLVTAVVPVTLFWTETADPLVQLVPVPVRVSVMLPEWFAGMAVGDAVKLADEPPVALNAAAVMFQSAVIPNVGLMLLVSLSRYSDAIPNAVPEA